MINLKSISKIFHTDVLETYALREFNLSVRSGEFVAITGHSGSGKTTLLNIVGLLEEFSSGSYHLEGEDVLGLNDSQLSRIRNQKIGFVFQGFNLIPNLNVYDNIEAPLLYRKMAGAERSRRIKESLERVGLTSRLRHFPAQLSGGQQQRVAIARAIAGDPRVILADEPTGNLDTTMSSQIMDLLHSINERGTTILMVTHNRELSQRAHRVVHMADGLAAALDPDNA